MLTHTTSALSVSATRVPLVAASRPRSTADGTDDAKRRNEWEGSERAGGPNKPVVVTIGRQISRDCANRDVSPEVIFTVL